MNVKPGDLAYIVRRGKPENLDWLGRVVLVGNWYRPYREWEVQFVGVRPASLPPGLIPIVPDSAMRPISGVPLADETPIETNVPEALKLALGIESRWRA